MSIAGPEDLQNFTRKWFATHKIPQPFEIDPSGRFAAEVQADCTLGDRLGLHETPTIIVLAPHGWIQVKDVTAALLGDRHGAGAVCRQARRA